MTRSKAKPAVAGGGLDTNGGAGAPARPHYSTDGAPRQPVPIRVAGRVVGVVDGDTFTKRVRGSIHQLRTPRAWCLDLRSLDDAEAAGAVRVEIHDVESGCVYRADIALIRRRGFRVSRGFGVQVALPLELWAVTRPGQPAARQLSLAGV